MWLLSCFFTSGWMHSCSREPSTHTLGLEGESTVGGGGAASNSHSVVPQREPYGDTQEHWQPEEVSITAMWSGWRRVVWAQESGPGVGGSKETRGGTGQRDEIRQLPQHPAIGPSTGTRQNTKTLQGSDKRQGLLPLHVQSCTGGRP